MLMNYRKLVGNVVAVAIFLVGIILTGGVKNAMGPGSLGVIPALIMYSPLIAAFFIARYVSRRIKGTGKES